MPQTDRGGSKIVTLAIISEAVLIGIAYAISWIRGSPITWNLSTLTISVGCACAVPLLVGNHFLWLWTKRAPDTIYARFSQRVVLPLCHAVSIPQAAIIALLSGVCEEALFRGAMNSLILDHAGAVMALLWTSITFAYVHFIGQMRQFSGMVPLYTFVGGVLWLVWWLSGSLAAVAAAHATYNFLAIVTMKLLDSSRSE